MRFTLIAAALYFAENQHITVVSNQVNLSETLPVITLEDSVALLLQVFRGQILPPISYLFSCEFRDARCES